MKNILLIGVGRFGRHIAMHLNQLGHQVMAVDRNEERIDAVMPYVTNAQIGDSVNADFLRSLGVGNYDVCIVTIGSSFQDSLETACLLKELGAKWVVSRAERDVQEKFLLRNGADQVVYPEKQMAKWTAIRYSSDHVFDYIEIDSQYAIFEVEIPENWIGKNVGQLDIRKKYGINILATRKYGKQMLRCLLRQFWMAMLPYWFLVNIKRSRNVFESEREVISVLSVGLLFVTLVGFLSGGVLVDQIETFFTENRREEPETGQNFTENRKQEQGTGEKKIS